MAGKDPKTLREQAKKLMAEAEKIENDRLIKIGKLTLQYFATGASDMSSADIAKFKTEIKKINGE